MSIELENQEVRMVLDVLGRSPFAGYEAMEAVLKLKSKLILALQAAEVAENA